MTAMSFALGFAAEIVAQAEDAGIPILSVDVYAASPEYTRLGLRAADDDLTSALAAELGLTDRRVIDYKDGLDIEAFMGYVGTIEVTTAHEIPCESLAVTA